MRDYSPEGKSLEICGVNEGTTLGRIAQRTLRSRRPAVVAIDERATLASNGLQAALAAQNPQRPDREPSTGRAASLTARVPRRWATGPNWSGRGG